MKLKELLLALIADLENKKSFEVQYKGNCYFCGDDMLTGDDLYFIGAKQKMCSNCLEEAIELLKAELEKCR